MTEYVTLAIIILTVSILISLWVGFIIGRVVLKKKKDGVVIIERTEDGDRERVRFVLENDLEELKYKKRLVLYVENTLSK